MCYFYLHGSVQAEGEETWVIAKEEVEAAQQLNILTASS